MKKAKPFVKPLNILTGVLAGSVLLVAVYLAFDVPEAAAPAPARAVTIDLVEQAESGEAGQAILIDRGEKTQVFLNLTGVVGKGNQPAGIYKGPCGSFNPAPVYHLNNAQFGLSETAVEASLNSLLAGGLVINVHKSPSEIKINTACGEIKFGQGEAKSQ